ncbi:FAD/NAD(P)-binding domain-containing protein [Periconia macrospinosa]|uniref:FAD/NAD(P)-binding domain-containing protein n=1 Tax=Periconia macrospinosa TaxID=97972 RepID=A0A2V1D5I5_9PLEO|nr:FAD/NAD(P)-binding domain-containing protein [Periconia macrospinosa]
MSSQQDTNVTNLPDRTASSTTNGTTGTTNGTTEQNPRISLALVGGGIAGLCTAVSIIKHSPQIDLTIYESCASFREIGAGVAIQPNAKKALALIDPVLRTAFDKISTNSLWPSKQEYWFDIRVGIDVEGKKAGDLVHSPKCPDGQVAVHRAKFLDELVKLVPEGICQFNKRVTEITEERGEDGDFKMHLKFKDGTEAVHDGIVGCDGVKSKVRGFVAPECEPTFTGKYCYRGVIPMHQAIEVLGEEKAMNNNIYMGKHGHVSSLPIEGGKYISVTFFGNRPSWPYTDWILPTDHLAMLADLTSKNWSPFILNLIPLTSHNTIYALFDQLDNPLPTYAHNHALVIGDAAHGGTPFQGSGAGMAIEDAYVLGEILKCVTARKDLRKAFLAFNQVRKERTQAQVRTGRESGHFWAGDDGEVGFGDWEIMRGYMDTRMRWIWDVDLEWAVRVGRVFMGVDEA